MSRRDPDEQKVPKMVIHVEDAVILISIGLLFWLGVLKRHEAWAQMALLGVLVVMAVVLVRRFRRVHRGFRRREGSGEGPDE